MCVVESKRSRIPQTSATLHHDWRHFIPMFEFRFRNLIQLAAVLLLMFTGNAHAAEAKGMLRVNTDKGAAVVYLGTEQIGTTPVNRYMDAGTYTIRVLKDGYEPFVRKIHIRPSQATDVNARLFEGKGSVEFVVEPAGAILTLNGGKDEWPTPVRLKDLDERKYSYTIALKGYETEKGSFTFKKGKNILVTALMQSSAGLLTVRSRPSGALVLLDGEEVGSTPLNLEEVEGGKHTIQLIKRGYASVFRQIDTSDGSKGEVEARMPKRGVPLTVRAGNQEANLSIEGMRFGPQATYRFGPVERGRYELVITAPDKKTIEQTVEVPLSGTALYSARLRPQDGVPPSVLNKSQPFYRHWVFYTAIGSAAALSGTVAAIAMSNNSNKSASTGKTTPNGDVMINLP